MRAALRDPATLTDQELDDLRAVHASMQIMSAIPFSVVLGDKAMRICLMNAAEARRRKMETARRKAVADAASFELTPT